MNIFSLVTPVIGFGRVVINSSTDPYVSLEMHNEYAEPFAGFEVDRTELDDLIEMLQEARVLAFGDK